MDRFFASFFSILFYFIFFIYVVVFIPKSIIYFIFLFFYFFQIFDSVIKDFQEVPHVQKFVMDRTYFHCLPVLSLASTAHTSVSLTEGINRGTGK